MVDLKFPLFETDIFLIYCSSIMPVYLNPPTFISKSSNFHLHGVVIRL